MLQPRFLALAWGITQGVLQLVGLPLAWSSAKADSAQSLPTLPPHLATQVALQPSFLALA